MEPGKLAVDEPLRTGRQVGQRNRDRLSPNARPLQEERFLSQDKSFAAICHDNQDDGVVETIGAVCRFSDMMPPVWGRRQGVSQQCGPVWFPNAAGPRPDGAVVLPPAHG